MKVIVEGHGTFTVNAEKVQELVQWLSDNAARVQEGFVPFDGKELLNESTRIN